MNIKDTFRYLVGAYYGIEEMDEYLTKEYILKDIENYIKDYLEENYDNSFNCKNEAIDVRDNVYTYKHCVQRWYRVNHALCRLAEGFFTL